MKKTLVQSQISLPRVLILGTCLLTASLPYIGWSAADDHTAKRKAIMARLRGASEDLQQGGPEKLDEKAAELKRLIGTIDGHTSALPALKAFLEKNNIRTLAEFEDPSK
jgi:hypothetical protein